MKTLLLMCGAPGSGKTYWAKKAMGLQGNEIPIKYFSRDEVRFEMVPEDEEYFSKEDAVFKEWIRRIQEALDSDEDCYVIADATHVSPKSRAKTLDSLRLGDTSIITVSCNPGLKVCLEQNAQRTGRARVPDVAIRQMHYNFVEPQEGEKYKYAATLVATYDEEEEGKTV